MQKRIGEQIGCLKNPSWSYKSWLQIELIWEVGLKEEIVTVLKKKNKSGSDTNQSNCGELELKPI
jgi:hypothetical protein